MKTLVFDSNLTEVYSWWCNPQYVNFGSGNGLAPSRRQAIDWASVDQDAWHHTYGVTTPQWYDWLHTTAIITHCSTALYKRKMEGSRRTRLWFLVSNRIVCGRCISIFDWAFVGTSLGTGSTCVQCRPNRRSYVRRHGKGTSLSQGVKRVRISGLNRDQEKLLLSPYYHLPLTGPQRGTKPVWLNALANHFGTPNPHFTVFLHYIRFCLTVVRDHVVFINGSPNFIYMNHIISLRFMQSQWKQWSLRWRHNGRDGVSNHQPYNWSLNRLLNAQIKETSKLRVTGLYAQLASNAENVSIWWSHNGLCQRRPW